MKVQGYMHRKKEKENGDVYDLGLLI